MSATRLPLCKRSLHEEPDTNATARIRDAGTLQAALEHASVPGERVMLPTLSRPMLRPAAIEERPVQPTPAEVDRILRQDDAYASALGEHAPTPSTQLKEHR
jgi:hypothetical protein